MGHSQFCPPLQKEQLTTIHGQDTTKKILEHGGEAEAPPCITDTRVLEGEEEWLCTDHRLAPGWHPPEPTVPSGTGAQGGHLAPPAL